LQSARVLRVGGTDADYDVLESALRGAGQTDLGRASVGEALVAIAACNVELILLDLALPGDDIVEVLRVAAPGGGARTRVPTIVTAPPGTEARIASCLQHGAEDFFLTPLDAANPLLFTRRIALALQRRYLREATVRLQSRSQGPDETAVIELHTSASSRFVPREFLDHLQRKTLADVKLGDHVERQMTVFFSDIRDFTTLSESLTPQQNFDFLNSYLRQVTPIVRARHGFIDKYIGDAIMALFPRSGGDALGAAVDVHRLVETYNAGRRNAGYVPIRIGIGLHRGSLILGTIGEEQRMQTTVISDAVNVASRIEGLTKTFGVGLLVSGSVVDDLSPEQRRDRHLRHLGAVLAKGKANSVEIFECYDNDAHELMEHKDKTGEAFVEAMREFRRGMFLTAGRIFGRIASMNPLDTVAAHYRDSCTLAAVRDRGPGPWDGAERIEVK
jgi:class 3 adenylate cyclase